MPSTDAAVKKRRKRFGGRVGAHCPYDEATLRFDNAQPGKFICPCCWSSFFPPVLAHAGRNTDAPFA